MRNVKSILIFEFRRILNSYIFWLGVVTMIGVPIFRGSPLFRSEYLWAGTATSVKVSLDVVMVASLIFIPILTGFLFFEDRTTGNMDILYTQPVTRKSYYCAKFLGGFSITIILVLVMNLITILVIPIFFGKHPYNPIYFIEAFILFQLPSIFFLTAINFFLATVIKNLFVSSPLAILYVPLDDVLVPHIFSFRYINVSEICNNLICINFTQGIPLNYLTPILKNILFIVVIGFLLLILSISIYSMRRGR